MRKIILISLFFAIAAQGQQLQRIAIMGTEDDGDPPIGIPEQMYLTDKLREIAGGILPKSRYSIMTQQSIVDMLGSQERAVKLCREATCLADLGRKVNADYVAQARIGRFSGNLTIKIELYRVGNSSLITSFIEDAKDVLGLRSIMETRAPDLFKSLPGVVEEPAAPAHDSKVVSEEEDEEYYEEYADTYGIQKSSYKIDDSIDYEKLNFSIGQRIGTSIFNIFFPSVGSIYVMEDWTGARTIWALMGAGAAILYYGVEDKNEPIGLLGGAIAFSGYIYGVLIRPASYDKPNSQNTAYRTYEGFNFTAMPNRHGNFMPAVIYNKAF
jgi:hypothetical protein